MRNRETVAALLAVGVLLLALVVPAASQRPAPQRPVPRRAVPEASNARVDHAAIVEGEAVAQGRWLAAQAAQEARNRARAAQRVSRGAKRPVAAPGVPGDGCGGDLPPCSVLACESGGNPTARNPGSSASGRWQITRGTWANFQGYPSAADAPPEVQDEKARALWRDGAGARHWQQCL